MKANYLGIGNMKIMVHIKILFLELFQHKKAKISVQTILIKLCILFMYPTNFLFSLKLGFIINNILKPNKIK